MPRTEAGKRALERWQGLKDGHGTMVCYPVPDILAIEAEAASQALRRIREGVAGLRELSDAASPDEWKWMSTGSEGGTLYSPDGKRRPLTGRIARFTGIRPSADGKFAAAAVNYVRSLLIDTEIGAEPE